MKRRSFVKGILGLTGLAASGASIAIEKIKPEELGKPLHGLAFNEIKWEFDTEYRKGSDIDKAIREHAKRMADDLEADFAKFMIRNSHLSS